MIFTKDILNNGVRVVVQEMPQAFSVTTGIWAATGSAYEEPQLAGISHFLEHMLFKGTETRTAKQIGEIMENVGGQMNAFTGKEHTCYYVKSLPEHFSLGIDVLADMLLHSTFPEEEFAKEKQVILEEISMYEDTPEDLVSENFMKQIYPDHIYGIPVIGSEETVSAMQVSDLRDYAAKTYTPKNIIVVVAGNIKREEVLFEAERLFGDLNGHWDKPVLDAPVADNGLTYTYKDIEQTHITFGFPSLAGDDDDVYTLQVLAGILGGGVTSRLFQEVREERGLSYSVFASNSLFAKGGNIYAYASTNPQKVKEMLEVMAAEFIKIADGGVTEEELLRTQAQLKCSILMSLENSANVMARLGKKETIFDEISTTEEIVKRINAVTIDAVQKLAKELFIPEKLVVSLVGRENIDFSLSSLFEENE